MDQLTRGPATKSPKLSQTAPSAVDTIPAGPTFKAPQDTAWGGESTGGAGEINGWTCGHFKGDKQETRRSHAAKGHEDEWQNPAFLDNDMLGADVRDLIAKKNEIYDI